MINKFIVENRRKVVDIRGYPVNPGNVVIVSRHGGSKGLVMEIVTSVLETRIYLAGKKYEACYENGKYNYKIIGINAGGGWSELSSNDIQNHLVVIEDPLFATENPKIEFLLELASMLKGDIFPNDYILGKSILEYNHLDS